LHSENNVIIENCARQVKLRQRG